MSEKVHDRLDSWKAIAEYLDRDPTTVMRWAKERGLPVYFVPGGGQRHRAVYAYKTEIDAWLEKPASLGLRVDQSKNQSEIPRGVEPERTAEILLPRLRDQNDRRRDQDDSERARNDTRPWGEVAGRAGTGGTVVPDLVRGEMARPSYAGERAAPQVPGMPVVAPDALGPLASSRAGTRRNRWAVLLGIAFLIALGAVAWLRVPPPEPRVLRVEQLTNDGLEKQGALVTDGARIYFIENRRDGWVVAQIPTSGGDPAAIARASANSVIHDISPDRTELLLIQGAESRPGSVWVLHLLGGLRRRLGAVQAYSAAWSPGGSGLAYTTDDGLYLCDANASNSRKVVAMSGRLDNVHWSPDGQHLCFRRASSTKATLWEVDCDGKRLRPLVPDSDMLYEGSSGFWTPDGKYFIFHAIHTGHPAPWALPLSAGLFKRNKQPTCLGSAGLDLVAGTMSPDGSRLYCSGKIRPRYQTERFDARSKQLVPCLPDIPASILDFTKDGQWIAYVDDNNQLWRSRKDGGGKVQLTLPPLEVGFPRWSPDGKWIAFMSHEPGQPWKVRVVSAGGGPYGPVDSTDAAEGVATWSPDGTRLLFGGLVSPEYKRAGPLVIHIFDLKERRLSVVPGSEGLWTARWSPDGRYIAALTEDSRSLMLFDFRGAKWAKLLTLDRIYDLHWSWQGESIYLSNIPPEGEPTLFRLKIPGHQLERLTGLKSMHDAGYLGLAPDDSPLIMHQVTGEEIYALECQFP